MGFYETTEPLFGQTMKLHILEVGIGTSGFGGKLGEMLGLFSVLGNEKITLSFCCLKVDDSLSKMKERMKFVFRRQVEEKWNKKFIISLLLS